MKPLELITAEELLKLGITTGPVISGTAKEAWVDDITNRINYLIYTSKMEHGFVGRVMESWGGISDNKWSTDTHDIWYTTAPIEKEKVEPPCEHNHAPYLATLKLFTDECPKCKEEL